MNGLHAKNSVDSETTKWLLTQIEADPQLPVPNPTPSLWQEKLHPLFDTKSPTLPKRTTYAIIGSGVTGCSVAKTLLEDPRSGSGDVVVLEARTLCSGATGRNGGHLVSPVSGEFTKVVAAHGIDMAVKIAKFNEDTLEKMHKLAAEADPATREAAEVRRTKSIYAFDDQALFDECREAVEMYENHVPGAKGLYRIISAKEANEDLGYKDSLGALEEPGGAFWPYRLVSGTFGSLMSQYKDRFSIETQTPVTQIGVSNNSNYPYVLETPRGQIEAKHVIHCTNGHASHLIPSLRGIMYPLRGTMSVQTPRVDFPHSGADFSWSLQRAPSYDPQSKTVEVGLYYITQNAKTANVYIGGEKSDIRELLTSDDSKICSVAEQNIANILPKIFNGYKNEKVQGVWSGIMGFTTDFLPLVGRLPPAFASGSGDNAGQWIAAGYNGYGMPQCWGAGEAVAKLILGGPESREEVFEWLPEAFEVSEQRFDLQNAAKASLRNLSESLGFDFADL